EHPGLAAVREQERGEHLDGGGLPGAVGAEDPVHRTDRHREVDPVDGPCLPERFDQARGLDRHAGRLRAHARLLPHAWVTQHQPSTVARGHGCRPCFFDTAVLRRTAGRPEAKDGGPWRSTVALRYAVAIPEPGGPEALVWDEVPVPEPGEGEVLVEVVAGA